jgi:ribosomal protein L34E
MTVAEYDAMYAAQNGVCAICGQPEIGLGRGGKVRRMSTDHDHTTGAIRGLLCHNCNFILGSAHDDPDVLRKAADYLEKHK